ncbi:hypothetical protein [Actinacidiphila sp. ITFR-21]|uniref:hypothetical protein n=1 Tax=Actinacidiphila sp. ITFR-21 TaxID=3075199 RepID=UPI00288C1EF4|nr:hypothetical protein [Streptomyces sp. ITFR-21]WNI17675.1 hypothetical protein RLT57_20510 [Streptomyces sp. ITFR-21]WNI17815.1 hypothetical protein RLT57_21225 [Streptomyces sp. ITFR-21]
MTNEPKGTAAPRPRWVRSKDPHTPGAFLKLSGKQIGRVLYSDFTRNYSCFVGEPSSERWLGCADDINAAKDKVDRALKADAERKEPAVWTFYSTGEAYGACQCREDIRDGDVLVIEREKVVGIAETWPFALTARFGDLHLTTADPVTYGGGKYAASIPVAEREAARMGVALVPRMTEELVPILTSRNAKFGELLGAKLVVREIEGEREHAGWVLAGTGGWIETDIQLEVTGTGAWGPITQTASREY